MTAQQQHYGGCARRIAQELRTGEVTAAEGARQLDVLGDFLDPPHKRRVLGAVRDFMNANQFEPAWPAGETA